MPLRQGRAVLQCKAARWVFCGDSCYTKALRSKKKMSITSFMREYQVSTEPNPFCSEERVLYRHYAAFRLYPSASAESVIQVDGIRSLQRGQGHGTAALRWLIALAQGCAVPYGTTRPQLTSAQLRAWYRRHGFTVRPSGQMWYLPIVPGTTGALLRTSAPLHGSQREKPWCPVELVKEKNACNVEIKMKEEKK